MYFFKLVLQSQLIPFVKIARAVAAQVLALPAFQGCKNVSCFLSMPLGELDTSEIVAEILKSGWSFPSTPGLASDMLYPENKSLFVPKVCSDGAMEFMKLYNQRDLDTLSSGLWGIREPSVDWENSPRVNGLFWSVSNHSYYADHHQSNGCWARRNFNAG